ncbi:hypothetical protein GCM10023148_55700 [Actinokineospora soli]
MLVPEPDHLGAVRTALAAAGYEVEGCQLAAGPLGTGPDGGTSLGPAESTFLVWGRGRASDGDG